MNKIGIIITGKRTYEIPESIWLEELEKIVSRVEDKDEDWELEFIIDTNLKDSPLLTNLKNLSQQEKFMGRFSTTYYSADWLRYKNQAGIRRDQKMVEDANYCLCFTPSSSDNISGPHKYLLKMARKERLIVREIYPESSSPTSPKPITPGSLSIFTKPLTTNEA